MTIAELKKDLSEALVSLNHGDIVTATRVEAWATALNAPGAIILTRSPVLQRDATPRPGRHGDMTSLTMEIATVLAKLAHWNSVDVGQASDA